MIETLEQTAARCPELVGEALRCLADSGQHLADTISNLLELLNLKDIEIVRLKAENEVLRTGHEVLRGLLSEAAKNLEDYIRLGSVTLKR